MSYRIEKKEDIFSTNEALINHEKYGIGAWIMSFSDAKTTCCITKREIEMNEKCYRPASGLPYTEERISVEGMNILIRKVKRSDIYQRSKLKKKQNFNFKSK